MAEQRNFRSAFLGKVVTKGVDEKKSLEAILSDKRVDIAKLEDFCARNHVEAAYRSYIWQIILGVIPVQQEISEYVLQQRRQQYEDLKTTLVVMQRVTEDTPQSSVLLRMYLMENGRLPLNDSKMFENGNSQAFLALTDGVSQVAGDPVMCYWLTSKLSSLQEKHRPLLSHMKDKLDAVLIKEDPQLHSHIQETSGMNALPAMHWFKSFFAGTLSDSAFERICDKVIGNSFLFLVCVAVSALIALRRPLLGKHSTEDIVSYVKKFPEESSDVIVKKATELWNKHGQTISASGAHTNLNLIINRNLPET